VNLYWKDGGVMRKAVVPGSPIAFSVGANCPCRNGFIQWINYDAKRYGCTDSSLRVRNEHADWPTETVEIEPTGDYLEVTNHVTGVVTRHFGEPRINHDPGDKDRG
jgi:hypothetical protein